jgi:hypothetical protein
VPDVAVGSMDRWTGDGSREDKVTTMVVGRWRWLERMARRGCRSSLGRSSGVDGWLQARWPGHALSMGGDETTGDVVVDVGGHGRR